MRRRGATLLAVASGEMLSLGAARPQSQRAAPGERSSVRLPADLSERRITIYQGDETARSYAVAMDTDRYPTPTGRFLVRKIVWNPGWVPSDSKWARNRTAKKPGDPGNPSKW